MRSPSAISLVHAALTILPVSLITVDVVRAQSILFLEPTSQYAISQGYGLSADASVLVGFCRQEINESQRLAFRSAGVHAETSASALVPPAPEPVSAAQGVSPDGSVAVGFASDIGTTAARAMRWVNGGPAEPLGTLPGATMSFAYAASNGGAIIVGAVYGEATRAFRWTSAQGMQPLENPPDVASSTIASGISADGSVVVGEATLPQGTRAFRWTAVQGLQALDPLAGGVGSLASGVTSNGSIVIGVSFVGASTHAVRWPAGASIPLALGTVGAATTTLPRDVSADGSTIVGDYIDSQGNPRGFLWTQAGGIVDLTTHVASLGVALNGWTLGEANAISDDGLTIAGTARSGNSRRAFIARLAPTSPACAADLDNDGVVSNGRQPDGGVDINDLLFFLSGFEEGLALVDLDNDGDPTVGTPDGGVDVNDLLFFLYRFEQGC